MKLQTEEFLGWDRSLVVFFIRTYVVSQFATIATTTVGLLHPGIEFILEAGHGKPEKVQRRATKRVRD